jgi:Spy/CpxP family protein refolding chaperone
MKLRTKLVGGAFAALLSVAAVAQTMGGGGHAGHFWGGHHGGGEGFGFLRGVSLTDEQKSKVHTVMQASWTQTRPLMKELRETRSQIADQFASTGALNAAQVTALQEKSEELRKQLDAQWLATATQIRNLLTPAQLAQAAQLHQQMVSLHNQERALLGHGEEP